MGRGDVGVLLGALHAEAAAGHPHGQRVARGGVVGGAEDAAVGRLHHGVAALEGRERWVPTHGEPHTRNQLATPDGVVLVDWESLRLAPRERDLRWLAPYDLAGADPSLVEMFDLEWRLDEVAQYAAWFHGPHTGTESDRVALGGLLHELDRPAGRTS